MRVMINEPFRALLTSRDERENDGVVNRNERKRQSNGSICDPEYSVYSRRGTNALCNGRSSLCLL